MSKSDIISAVRPVINLLEELRIPYYIGGSIASSSLGISRATLDVDLIANLNSFYVDKIVKRLDTDYYIDRDMIADAIKHNSSFNVIHHETSYKVDFFISRQDAYQQAIFDRITKKKLFDKEDELTVYICSAEDVVLTKILWYKERGGASEKQWSDILGVLKVQKNNINIQYMETWSKKLGISEELEKVFIDAGIN